MNCQNKYKKLTQTHHLLSPRGLCT